MADHITHDRLAAVFIKIRDRRSELKRQFEEVDNELKDQQERIKARLIHDLKAEKVNSKRTDSGTITLVKNTKVWASDWEGLHNWIVKNNVPEVLTKQIHQTNMQEFIKQHPNNFPPGINIDTETTVRINKPTAKKGD